MFKSLGVAFNSRFNLKKKKIHFIKGAKFEKCGPMSIINCTLEVGRRREIFPRLYSSDIDRNNPLFFF